MSDAALHQRYLAAAAIAGEAGNCALTYLDNPVRLGLKMKGFQDYLTAADGAVETLVRRRIAEAFPTDAILGEEGGGAGGDHLWIVDPIDGTANFARGEPHWSVSIGFVRGGIPEFGVVFAPVLSELFAARRGAGATLNGRAIAVSQTADMRSAVVEIGWSPRRPVETYLSLIGKVMSGGAAARRSASGALGMAYVACGRVDAYLELHINCWDVAAGFVLAREAGAVVNDYFSGDWLMTGNPILAATPALAGPLSHAMGLDVLAREKR